MRSIREVYCNDGYEYVKCIFLFNDTATAEIYTLSLHDALPISREPRRRGRGARPGAAEGRAGADGAAGAARGADRKSTRLNSSHANISYAVFCLKKKNGYITLLLLILLLSQVLGANFADSTRTG